MAGLMKNAMSFFGMSDVVDDDDDDLADDDEARDGFDTDHSVTPMAPQSTSSSQEAESTPFQSRINRITTIHPEAQIIWGLALDDAYGDEVRVTVIAAGFDPTPKKDETPAPAVDTTTAPAAATPVQEPQQPLTTPSAQVESDETSEHDVVPPASGDDGTSDPGYLDIPDFLR